MKIAIVANIKLHDNEEEAEFDTPETLKFLSKTIENLGHQVVVMDAASSLLGLLISRLQQEKPDLVFNLAEGSGGRGREALFPALYEALGIPYTGSDATTLAITMDKALTKRLLNPYNGSRVLRPGKKIRTYYKFPGIIKPNFEGSSKGITQTSVVSTQEELEAAAETLLKLYPAGLIVEPYIDGLDAAMGWIEGVGCLEPTVYEYEPTGKWKIYDLSLKRSGKNLVKARIPSGLSEHEILQMRIETERAVKDLRIRGCCRVDFRIGTDGPVFLEVNALPSLAPGEDAEMYKAVEHMGLGGPEVVIKALIESAMKGSGV